MDPVDVIILCHNRLRHLIRTIDALLERTPEPPIQLTIVDNASEADVRNWLAEHRDRFAQLILRPTNEYVPAFQHGIDATSSDPFVVTDPDLVVPDLSPSWLSRLLGTMERHPDVGLVGADLDEASYTPALRPDELEALAALRGRTREVDGSLIEGNVGTCFQLIRRDALREPYVSDFQACRSVRRAGFRVGWNPAVKAYHLGAHDFELHPEHVLNNSSAPGFMDFRILLDEAPRPPTLPELAAAGPLIARTRAAGVPDRSVLEVAWGAPALGAAVAGPMTLHEPPAGRLPLEDDAAGAVVVSNAPADRTPELLAEAFRIAVRLVVLDTSLHAVEGRLAEELAAPGWHGVECRAVGELAMALAREGDASASLADRLAPTTLEHREGWLALFAAGAFGLAEKRMFVFDTGERRTVPPVVRHDPAAVTSWRPEKPPLDAAREHRRRETIQRAVSPRRRPRRLRRRVRAGVSRGARAVLHRARR